MKKIQSAPLKKRDFSNLNLSPKKDKHKTYLFNQTEEDIENLDHIIEKVNQISKKEIHKSDILRSLIRIGISLEPHRILKNIV